jgi:hypothetical protein
MYQSIIEKLEAEKVAKRATVKIQVAPPIEIESDTLVAKSVPAITPGSEIKKVSFKDKVKNLQSASNKVKKPVQLEIKKKRSVVELW